MHLARGARGLPRRPRPPFAAAPLQLPRHGATRGLMLFLPNPRPLHIPPRPLAPTHATPSSPSSAPPSPPTPPPPPPPSTPTPNSVSCLPPPPQQSNYLPTLAFEALVVMLEGLLREKGVNNKTLVRAVRAWRRQAAQGRRGVAWRFCVHHLPPAPAASSACCPPQRGWRILAFKAPGGLGSGFCLEAGACRGQAAHPLHKAPPSSAPSEPDRSQPSCPRPLRVTTFPPCLVCYRRSNAHAEPRFGEPRHLLGPPHAGTHPGRRLGRRGRGLPHPAPALRRRHGAAAARAALCVCGRGRPRRRPQALLPGVPRQWCAHRARRLLAVRSVPPPTALALRSQGRARSRTSTPV
jgi:hypothetical protein